MKTYDQLSATLAERAMGWIVGPNRFLTGGRQWISRWRFQPFENIADAYLLLDRVADRFVLVGDRDSFSAEVHIGGRVGIATGAPKARTITTAIAHALGVEVD